MVLTRADHALVFLADEQQHGQGFPPGIERKLRTVLADRGVDVSAVPDEPPPDAPTARHRGGAP